MFFLFFECVLLAYLCLQNNDDAEKHAVVSTCIRLNLFDAVTLLFDRMDTEVT